MDEHGLTDGEVIVEKWEALLSGCCGFNTGTYSLWWFGPGYASDFASPANVGVSKIPALLADYQWWTLVPRNLTSSGANDNSLVSSAKGSGATRICCALGDHPQGKFALAIVPTATSPTVSMGNFPQASVRARWFDITNGTFVSVGGQPFANSGSQTMAHPGNNALGESSWLLVLDPG
jgi:hypothetical protein